MTYRQWEKAFRKRLSRLPKEERERALGYYAELYGDMLDAGMDTDIILRQFGDPEESADRIIAEFSEGLQLKSCDQKSYEIKDPVHSLRIEYSDAPIFIEYSDTAERILIHYPLYLNKRGEEIAPIKISEQNGTLLLVEQPSAFDGKRNLHAVRVTLPAIQEISLDVHTMNSSIMLTGETNTLADLSLCSSNGSIVAKGIFRTPGTATFSTSNGSIIIADIAAAHDLLIRSSNGSIQSKNISAENIEAHTINGSINLTNITAENAAVVETRTSSISLSGIIKAKLLRASTMNGAITLKDGLITADEIALSSETGAISSKGSAFAGAQSDYTVLVSTDVGDSNVSDSVGGNRKLTLSTGTGDIRVYFES